MLHYDPWKERGPMGLPYLRARGAEIQRSDRRTVNAAYLNTAMWDHRMETQNASWVLMFCANGPFPSQGCVCGAQGSQKRYVHICWCMSIDYTMKTHTINCQSQNRGTLHTNQSRHYEKPPQNNMPLMIRAKKRWKQTQANAKKLHFRSRMSIMRYY